MSRVLAHSAVSSVRETTFGLLFSRAATLRSSSEEGPWAPGYYSLSFRDPEGIRLELNHVPVRACSPKAPRSTRRPNIRSRAGLEPESDRALPALARRSSVRLPFPGYPPAPGGPV
jgi:hypothetical protein